MLNKEKPVDITFDIEKCTKCGLCVKACSGEHLLYKDNQVIIDQDSLFGCIQCGHCMMSCPNDAIKVRGEGISENDIFLLDNNVADYYQLCSLLTKRRSMRHFQQQEISQEIIDKILLAASTGAISIPPYEVKVLVIKGFDRVQEFADDISNSLKNMTKIMNPFTLKLFKPFIGATNYKLFNDFVLPLIKTIIDRRKEGRDILFYNAPALILFYTTELCDKEDALISATLATIAAESLGIGTCIIGTVPPALNKNPKLKEKYGILKNETVAITFVLGYPDRKFSKGIKRRFKTVRYQ